MTRTTEGPASTFTRTFDSFAALVAEFGIATDGEIEESIPVAGDEVSPPARPHNAVVTDGSTYCALLMGYVISGRVLYAPGLSTGLRTPRMPYGAVAPWRVSAAQTLIRREA